MSNPHATENAAALFNKKKRAERERRKVSAVAVEKKGGKKRKNNNNKKEKVGRRINCCSDFSPLEMKIRFLFFSCGGGWRLYSLYIQLLGFGSGSLTENKKTRR